MLEALIRRIDVSNFPIPLRIAARDEKHAGGMTLSTLSIAMSVRDRDTGKQREIIFGCAFGSSYERQEEECHAIERIRGVLRNALVHELDECFRVDGKLYHDPHV